MADIRYMGRRALLKGFPAAVAAAGLASCVPMAFAGPTVTPIQRLFCNWYDAQKAFIAIDEDLDWEANTQAAAMNTALADLRGEPVTCIEDLALKTMALTWLGDFALTREGVEESKTFLDTYRAGLRAA